MMLNEEQVDEVARLRMEEGLTRREIAHRLRVGIHRVSMVWHRLPDQWRRPLSDELRAVLRRQCTRCGLFFDDSNPQAGADKICTLCALQEEGRVVLYRGGARDTTQAIRSGRCCLSGVAVG